MTNLQRWILLWQKQILCARSKTSLSL